MDGVTFDVREGEIFAIVGPNGAGKSTIFNLISRIYEPTGGRLIFQGEDITNVPPHTIAGRGIARTFQNIELFEHATVLDNLLIGRHCRSHGPTSSPRCCSRRGVGARSCAIARRWRR